MFEMRRSYIDYPFAIHDEVGRHERQEFNNRSDKDMPGGQLQTSRLPVIPSATPNPGTMDRTIIPILPTSRDPIGYRTGGDIESAEDRLRLMESRLGGTEKSNRALLEEVVRLQGELRIMVRRNEESLKDEKVSRQQMEGSMQIVNDLISQLSNRIRTAEDKIMEEKSAISSLVTHTKGVEKAVVTSQRNLSEKKDSQTSKIQQLTLLLSEIKDSRDQLEKQTYVMSEELRGVRSKVDSQGLELNSTVSELKLKSRRLEEENKIQLEALRKQGDMYSSTETNTIQLRGQVENRLSELRDVVTELRTRQDQEANERRNLENTLSSKMNTVQQGLADQNRKREEAMHAMDMIHREKEHNAESDKLKLQGRMTESMEEVNKRLLTKEIKIREDLQEKFTQLERTIQHEQQVRLKYEAALREENDKRWLQLKKIGDDESTAIKDTFQTERQKNKEAVHKLDESISLLEKHLAENKRQSDKVVAAEIKSRKIHEKTTAEKLDHVNEKLSLATSSLQQAIGGAAVNLNTHADKLRAEMKTMINTSEQTSTRAMTDMDARLQSVKQKLNNLEQQIDGRISEATAILAQNLREKVESISLWQDVTSQTIRELNTSIQGLPNDIYAVEEKHKLLKSEMDSRVTTEADARIRDIEYLKHELSLLKNKRDPQAPTMQDLQETQASIRKLAESIQTVKTVVGMKIQSEQKLRLEGLEDLQVQLNRLKSQAGMHSAVHSAMPMYTTNDMDSAYEMEDFMRHDITQDIPYGRSSVRQPTTRLEDNSQQADPNGYAAQYSRNRYDPPPQDQTPRGGASARTPLDTVSEAKDDEEAWDILHNVAFGNLANEDKAEDNDVNRPPSNKRRFGNPDDWTDDEKKSVTGDEDASGDNKTSEPMSDEGVRKTPERAVTRHNSNTTLPSPVDEARTASLKGATNMGRLDNNMSGTMSPQSNAVTEEKPEEDPMNNKLDQQPAIPDGRKSNASRKSNVADDLSGMKSPQSNDVTEKKSEKDPMNNKLDWQPATPDGRKSNASRKSNVADDLSGMKSPQSNDVTEKKPEKDPMNNKLDWQPATPDGRKSNASRKSNVSRKSAKQEVGSSPPFEPLKTQRLDLNPATPTNDNDMELKDFSTDNKDSSDQNGDTESDREKETRYAEQILAEV